MTYNPAIKLFYTKGNEVASASNRLIPAPQISIQPEYIYANDTIIGYTYNVTLSGYSTSLDLSQPLDPNNIPNFDDVALSIQKVKNIFNGNDGSLIAQDSSGAEVFKLTGGNIRSLNFRESENNWVNYAEYSAELDFNEIRLSDCGGLLEDIVCGEIPSGITPSSELLDMKIYKVKSFSDSWSFSLDENIYNRDSDVRNEHFNINYSVNVTGKHYFVDNKVLPAWEQAKNYAEYRLKQQVNRLNTQILKIPGDSSGCSLEGDLDSIFGSGPPGLISTLGNSQYKIYNEKINTSTSEAEGSFSLEYSAILKRSSASTYATAETLHSYSVTKNFTDDGSTRNTSISISGSIQGLIEGGLIKQETNFSFPANGTFLIGVSNNISKNKYNNALATFQLVADIADKTLKKSFASFLGVTNANLDITNSCAPPNDVPKAKSFNATHDYNQGIINYSCEYDANTALCSDYTSVSISVQEKTPIVAEFIVPGRSAGPIIQRINAKTPKKITLSIAGANPAVDCCANADDLVEKACAGTLFVPNSPAAQISGMKLTRNSSEIGNDGSYSINREYIVCDND
jgi:hypothetical protein